MISTKKVYQVSGWVDITSTCTCLFDTQSLIKLYAACTTLLNVMNLFLNWSFFRCLLYVSKGFWKGECTDILYLLSYLFGTKFTGRKFYCWHRDNWPIGQWVINYLHCSRHSLQCMSIIFSPAWVYNIIKIHSGKIRRPWDFIARSVAALPHALKAHFAHF